MVTAAVSKVGASGGMLLSMGATLEPPLTVSSEAACNQSSTNDALSTMEQCVEETGASQLDTGNQTVVNKGKTGDQISVSEFGTVNQTDVSQLETGHQTAVSECETNVSQQETRSQTGGERVMGEVVSEGTAGMEELVISDQSSKH